MAINDITGKVIKTSPVNAQYVNGWDRLFAKKTSDGWLKHPDFKGIVIMDPDGWRYDSKSMTDEISYSEFCTRLSQSTIIGNIDNCLKNTSIY
jgi:hypothetical protein